MSHIQYINTHITETVLLTENKLRNKKGNINGHQVLVELITGYLLKNSIESNIHRN